MKKFVTLIILSFFLSACDVVAEGSAMDLLVVYPEIGLSLKLHVEDPKFIIPVQGVYIPQQKEYHVEVIY